MCTRSSVAVALGALILSLLVFGGSALAKDGLRPGPWEVAVRDQATGKGIPAVVVHLGAYRSGTNSAGKAVFDGVPAGTYRLRIEHAGFDTLTREITLPEGHREALGLTLTKSVLTYLKGTVVVDDSREPVPGALVHLMPYDVPASVRGPASFRTNYEGAFELFELPIGKYRGTIEAPGIAKHAMEVILEGGDQTLAWAVTAEAKAARAAVRVFDAATRQPIPSAKVILATAYPRGLIAELTTDAGGSAQSGELQVGMYGGTDPDAAPHRVRPHIVARVEAEGYAPTTAPIALLTQPSIEVALASLTPVSKSSVGDVLPLGTPVQLRLDEPDKRHSFRISLPRAGALTVRLSKCSISTNIRLVGPGGKELRTQWAYPNREHVLGPYSLAGGTYAVELGAQQAKAVTEDDLVLTATFDPAPDSFEPNDRGSAGRRLVSGERISGYICPTTDVDVWRFELERPARVRVLLSKAPIVTRIRVLDALDRVLADGWQFAGRDLLQEVELNSAGTYQIEVMASGNQPVSVKPYDLQLVTLEGDGITDPVVTPTRVRAVRKASPQGIRADTILPRGDRDVYQVDLPTAGRFTARVTAPFVSALRILDGRGKELANTWGWARKGTHATTRVPGPARVFVEVRQSGDQAAPPSALTLRTRFEACDTIDALLRDDQLASAWPHRFVDVARGSFMPAKDVDLRRLIVDHPGRVVVQAKAPITSTLKILDARGKALQTRWNWPNKLNEIAHDVVPGVYYVAYHANAAHEASSAEYEIRVTLHRAEPAEGARLAADPARTIPLGVGTHFKPDAGGDVDRFLCSVPAEGTYRISWFSPITSRTRVFDDRTGKKLLDRWDWGGARYWDAKVTGPTRLRIEMSANHAHESSPIPGYLVVHQGASPLCAATVRALVNPVDPTDVEFVAEPRKGVPMPARVEVDADGDGQVDLKLVGGRGRHRYRAAGRYAAKLHFLRDDGATTHGYLWVEARGPIERRGVLVGIAQPVEGQAVEQSDLCLVSAVSFTGARIDRVEVSIDGQRIGVDRTPPYEVPISWRRLSPGPHVVEARAIDRGGEEGRSKRTVTVSDYFDLEPADGATQSGERVTVRWYSPRFGPAVVDYRKVGEEDWQQVIGPSGRDRVVLLEGLEAGAEYEWRPMGGATEGPVRRVRRVKGLSFGRPTYSAVIDRDYDQRAAISVRNNSEAAMTVHLACDAPAESHLLVGFVGEGSADQTFSLDPGAEREFLLVFSAQDVIKPRHTVPIRIVSEGGWSDRALVDVTVRLPKVALRWEKLGPTEEGLGTRYRLINEGDTLTDLSITADSPAVELVPSILHGLFSSRSVLEIEARPRLEEGFQFLEATISAKALDKEEKIAFEARVPDGESLHRLVLAPGAAEDPLAELAAIAQRAQVDTLDPDAVDWDRGTNPQDLNSDGKVDRWEVRRPSVTWIGDDTDDDGIVDFVHADVGHDGAFEYSALRRDDAWESTNLVEAWLEMGFTLPWARDAYHPHDLEILLNDTVIGSLEDSIPEGNYSFYIPPHVIHFDDGGRPVNNRVAIRSKHLRGGHYVVNSDFRFSFRLTSTPVWMAGADREKASERAQAMKGLEVGLPDLSVASSTLQVLPKGKPEAGAPLVIEAGIRSIGAETPERVVVALFEQIGRREQTEVSRVVVTDLSPSRPTHVRLPFVARPGKHRFRVVIDPDKTAADSDRQNNEAALSLHIEGDETAPTLEISVPQEGARLPNARTRLDIQAKDDQEVRTVRVSIDRGLWEPLEKTDAGFGATLLLQPGPHVLRVRVFDAAGNVTEATRKVVVEGTRPELALVTPAEAATVEAPSAKVVFTCGADVVLAGARIRGGPWHPVAVAAGKGELDLALPFGQHTLEVLVARADGVVSIVSRPLRCTAQRTEEDEPVPTVAPPDHLKIEGMQAVDIFRRQNLVLREDNTQEGGR